MEERKGQLWNFCPVLGGLILSLPNSVLFYWGNISVYVRSYFRMKDFLGTSVESPWLLSAYIVSVNLTFLLAGTVAKVLGRKGTVALGILMVDGGLLSSYFTVQHSIPSFNLSQGIFVGIGSGLLYSIVLEVIVEYSEKNLALLLGFVSMTFMIGGAMITQIVSWYINPENETPSLQLGPIVYFTQLRLLARVPNLYLVLGSVGLATHLIGLALVRRDIQKTLVKDKVKDVNTGTSSVEISSRLPSVSGTNYAGVNVLSHSKEKDALTTSSAPLDYAMGTGLDSLNTFNENSLQKHEEYDNILSENIKAVNCPRPEIVELDLSYGACTPNPRISDSLVVEDDNPDDKAKTDKVVIHTAKEMLQHRVFYFLWMLVFVSDLEVLVFINYFKAFGQSFIKNDHSLSNLATVVPIIVASFRLVFGHVIDKLCSKHVIVFFSSALSMIFALYYFTPMVSPWLYYLWSIILPCMDIGLYANFPVIILRLYGPENMSTKYAFVLSATIVLNLGVPPFLRLILEMYGWFALFFGTGLMACLGLFIAIFGLPRV